MILALALLTYVLLLIFIKHNFEPYDYREFEIVLTINWLEEGTVFQLELPYSRFWKIMKIISLGYVDKTRGEFVVLSVNGPKMEGTSYTVIRNS